MADPGDGRRFPEGPMDHELNMGVVYWVLIVVFLLVGGAFGLMYGMNEGFEDLWARYDEEPSPLSEANELVAPPAPNLQNHPEHELVEMRAEQELQLHSYGWVSEERGIVRIPIEEAMQKVLRDGVPSWPAAPVEAGADTGAN